MARQAERREATRGAIIRAGIDLFGRNGFAATTVDQLAEQAGVAKGAVYHHYSTKEAIFEAVFDKVSADVAVLVSAAARQAPDAIAAIAVGTKAYFRICSEGPVGRIILGDGPVVLGWQRWREVDSRHFGAMMPMALEAAVAQGLIEEQPVRTDGTPAVGRGDRSGGGVCGQQHTGGDRAAPCRGAGATAVRVAARREDAAGVIGARQALPVVRGRAGACMGADVDPSRAGASLVTAPVSVSARRRRDVSRPASHMRFTR